jgi:sec-independent protein translocase protein TatA
MPNIGAPELIVILVIALIVLGPKRLPEVGRSVGKGMREFKESLAGDEDDDDHDRPVIAAVEDPPPPVAAPAPAPVAVPDAPVAAEDGPPLKAPAE